ncbi:MAG: hypothetical protein QXV32_06775 [Conexivisphaerales archaeon]
MQLRTTVAGSENKPGNGSLKDKLFYIRHKLFRKRLYYRALNNVERGIVHLVLKLDVKLAGKGIISAVMGIIEKAQAWLRPSLYQRAIAVGQRLAEVNVNIALHWGLDAMSWLEDKCYILLLGLNAIASNWRGFK